jgi:predicted DsbA family dithiol-disulfide isomerase
VRAVHVTYYTDPASPASWAGEPALRRVLARFGEGVSIAYVMGGLARRIDDPVRMLHMVLDVAAESAMPVDPRLWLEHPPASSYPACLAVKAAAEQGLDGPYLRRAREGLMCERRKLDNADALVDLARAVDGIDVARFAIDLASNAIVESFGADLERTREAARASDKGGRLPFVEVEGAPGVHDVAELERLVERAGASPVEAPPGVEAALRRFGRMATPEVAAVCELPGPLAAARLWQLAAEWKVRPQRAVAGELWQSA